MKRILLVFLGCSAWAGSATSDRPVMTGLDVLVRQRFESLAGKNVGLITNHTGLSLDGKRNVDLMISAGVKVKVLFSPEHGIAGLEDKREISNSTDAKTGLKIYSLHAGEQHRMTPEMLKGVDTLVYDIQDVGARFYTYSCTMIYALEDSAHLRIPFYLLDRPNPITGEHVEGPVIDAGLQSYVGCAPIPIRHGMTFGELAQFANGERKLGADLRVVKMEGWKRGDWWDATNLPWLEQPSGGDPLYGDVPSGANEGVFGGARDQGGLRTGWGRLAGWRAAGRISQ